MAQESKYTSFKLLLSYFLLLGLMAFAVWYLLHQQSQLNQLFKSDTNDESQLVYTELIRDLYETDNRSRIALQTKSKKNVNAFLEKNDKIVQSGNTRDMIYDIDTLIAHVSQFMTLKIGDILFTGTPAGVGPVAIDDRLKGYLEDEPIFTVNIK